MAVKQSVFASTSEKKCFYKLGRTWGDAYRIYHNLPFLNVFDTRNLIDFSVSPCQIFSLSDEDYNRLKKTSIDFVFCDQNEKPILAIEFDGLSEGFNVESNYYPQQPLDTSWRETIMGLKLKVAYGSMFPYFVLGSRYFDDLSNELKVNIADGIIGDFFTDEAIRKQLSGGFHPESVGISEDEFDILPECIQSEIIWDWVISVEVECEYAVNPLAYLCNELMETLEVYNRKVIYHTFPEIPKNTPIAERGKLLLKCLMHGATVEMQTKDVGTFKHKVMIPRFRANSSGYILAENIATLTVLEEVRNARMRRIG
jgi:hypothetical protein